MRKCVAVIVLMVLVCSLHTVALGAENELLIENVTVQKGETVYVTWKLSQSVAADAVAVIFSYDKAVLKPLESSSTWAEKGLIQAFDMVKGTGVWTAAQPVLFSGEVCSVAFQVITKEAHFDTEVTCTLRLKNGGNDIGEFTTTAWVSSACEHSFGQWSSNGSFNHGRVCALCERKQSAPHNWKAGKTVDDPDNVNKKITTFTCEDCQEEKKVFHFENEKPNPPGPTEPEELSPTGPTQPPENRPTNPGGNGTTRPTNPKDDHDHDHDHTQTEPKMDNAPQIVGVAFGVVAAVVAIIAFLRKKKKR